MQSVQQRAEANAGAVIDSILKNKRRPIERELDDCNVLLNSPKVNRILTSKEVARVRAKRDSLKNKLSRLESQFVSSEVRSRIYKEELAKVEQELVEIEIADGLKERGPIFAKRLQKLDGRIKVLSDGALFSEDIPREIVATAILEMAWGLLDFVYTTNQTPEGLVVRVKQANNDYMD